MRIVCLITVGAFLLSIAMAEGEMPMGVQHYHQRVQRPIILEPLKKYKSNDGDTPLHWFFNAVSRAMEPPPKPAPRMIGPINVPGLGGQVYIKEIHNTLPWESKHIVIRMKSGDPVNGMIVPMDASGLMRNRFESSSRRVVKPYGYQQMNNYQGRPNNANQQGFTPVAPSHPSWSNQYRQRPQQYSASYSKPLRPSHHNDFRYENYQKETDQSFSNQQSDDYRHSFNNNYQNFQPISGSTNAEASEAGSSIASPSMYQPIAQKTPIESDYSNDYNDQPFTESSKNSDRQGEHFYKGKPDSIRSTEIPYPEYPPLRDQGGRSSAPRNIGNETKNIETINGHGFHSAARYRSVVRADRMVPVIPKRRNNFFAPISRGRTANVHNTQGSRVSANFPIDSTTKFDSDDSSGIEVIAAPNLNRDWAEGNRKIGNNQGLARSSAANSDEVDSDINQDEDSMSMENGRSLARGESTEHSNDQPEVDIEKPVVTRRAQSRISYNVIDRSHRSQGSQNITSASQERSDEKTEIDSKENEKNRSIEKNDRSSENISTISKIDSTTKPNNVTAEVVQKVMNLTASNRWRLPERRKPRIVKAIYRRKARFGVIKSSRESSESNESSNEKKSSESSKE